MVSNVNVFTRVVIHVLLEGLGEALGAKLADVHGKDNEVEVPLNVVHDLGLEVGLPVVGGDVKGHLGLNDALTNVLNTSSTRGRGGKVNQLVNLRKVPRNISFHIYVVKTRRGTKRSDSFLWTHQEDL